MPDLEHGPLYSSSCSFAHEHRHTHMCTQACRYTRLFSNISVDSRSSSKIGHGGISRIPRLLFKVESMLLKVGKNRHLASCLVS